MKDYAKYMDVLRDHVLKRIDTSKLDEDVMFRIVDAQPLAPRFRVEMGFVLEGQPVLFSTMMVKDPLIAARQIAEEIENVGGYFNACTSRETTSFYIKVLKEDLPLAVDILADILLHSTFAPDEFDREKAVVLQEINQSVDTPDDIIFDYFQETAFPNQSFGRPVLGSVETVKGVSRETLNRYLKSNYTPEAAAVASCSIIVTILVVVISEKVLGLRIHRF